MAPVNTRSKAAAWAWYQRSAGSPAPSLSSARSVPARRAAGAALQRSFTRAGSSPSRFKLEADQQLFSGAVVDNFSDRLKDVQPEVDFGNDTTSLSACDATRTCTPCSNLSTSSPHAIETTDRAVLAPSSSYGTSAWDCGSALFDSFELAAMSKRLEEAHQLNDGTMDLVSNSFENLTLTGSCGSSEILDEGTCAKESEGKESSSTVSQLNGQARIDHADEGTVAHYSQSKAAIYDMFCRYEESPTTAGRPGDDDEPDKELQRSTTLNSLSRPHSGKRYSRRRLQNISKAFVHPLLHLTGQSHTAPQPSWLWLSDGTHLCQSAPVSAKKHSPVVHPHHEKPPDSPLPHQTLGDQIAADLTGLRLRAANGRLKKRQTSDDVHHHHYHHHYHHHHHLYHHSHDSISGSADKSLLVAMAGLRASKRSPLHTPATDLSRRRSDSSTIQAAFGTFEAPLSPNVQEQ